MGSRIFGRRFFALAIVAPGLLGCVDPGKRFDDFNERVIDAGPAGPSCEGALQDINGEFLVTLAPGFFPDRLLQFIATVELTTGAGTGTADFSFQPIYAEICAENMGEPEMTGTPVGDPLEATGVEIDGAGAYEFMFDEAQVDGRANAVSCGAILADITLTGIIQSPDVWCGEASGMVKAPTPANLEGSTFGAIRIEEGTVGEDLPDPQPVCPACGEPDAG